MHEIAVEERAHKIPVAILGATGSVGQRMVEMLSRHPWFEIVQVAASDRSVGKRYREAVTWLLSTPIPEKIRSMEITDATKPSDARIVFSALDAYVAEEIEQHWANQGVSVVTNARPHREHPEVPLIIPEVNAENLGLLHYQKFAHGGIIVANPNCVSIGLSLALAPLVQEFKVDKVSVSTYQSASGAGFPGIPSLSLLDNLIPFISGEEEKLEKEPLKVFARLDENYLHPASMAISASCVRVPIIEGHLKSVSVNLQKSVSLEEIKAAFVNYSSPISKMGLPTAPHWPIYFFEEIDAPQPRFHRFLENGMSIAVGGLRSCSLFDYKFFVLSHNLIRGAAGGSILIAELLVKQKWV